MDPLTALAVLAALVAVAAIAGILLARSGGRVRAGSAERVDAADLGVRGPLGPHATLVQFSSPTCASCPGTARVLASLAAERPGVLHHEVDLAARPDVADRFGVLQTPTTLLLDGGNRIRARVGGAPDRVALARELDLVLGRTHA